MIEFLSDSLGGGIKAFAPEAQPTVENPLTFCLFNAANPVHLLLPPHREDIAQSWRRTTRERNQSDNRINRQNFALRLLESSGSAARDAAGGGFSPRL